MVTSHPMCGRLRRGRLLCTMAWWWDIEPQARLYLCVLNTRTLPYTWQQCVISTRVFSSIRTQFPCTFLPGVSSHSCSFFANIHRSFFCQRHSTLRFRSEKCSPLNISAAAWFTSSLAPIHYTQDGILFLSEAIARMLDTWIAFVTRPRLIVSQCPKRPVAVDDREHSFGDTIFSQASDNKNK